MISLKHEADEPDKVNPECRRLSVDVGASDYELSSMFG